MGREDRGAHPGPAPGGLDLDADEHRPQRLGAPVIERVPEIAAVGRRRGRQERGLQLLVPAREHVLQPPNVDLDPAEEQPAHRGPAHQGDRVVERLLELLPEVRIHLQALEVRRPRPREHDVVEVHGPGDGVLGQAGARGEDEGERQGAEHDGECDPPPPAPTHLAYSRERPSHGLLGGRNRPRGSAGLLLPNGGDEMEQEFVALDDLPALPAPQEVRRPARVAVEVPVLEQRVAQFVALRVHRDHERSPPARPTTHSRRFTPCPPVRRWRRALDISCRTLHTSIPSNPAISAGLRSQK